jgi:hypothetical protein
MSDTANKSRRTGDTANKSRRTGDTANNSRRTGDTADQSMIFTVRANRSRPQSASRLSPAQRISFVAAIAFGVLLALFASATEQAASEAQFDAKLQTAAVAVDTGLSQVQKFFPASFR